MFFENFGFGLPEIRKWKLITYNFCCPTCWSFYFLKPATTDFCSEISFNGLEIRKISSAQKIWKPWKICTIFWLVNFNACWPIPTKNAQMLLFFTDLNWPEVDQRIRRETSCSTLRSCLSKSIIEFFSVVWGCNFAICSMNFDGWCFDQQK